MRLKSAPVGVLGEPGSATAGPGSWWSVLRRCLGYGGALGAGLGFLAGLPFYVFGAVYGCPIGFVYGLALGLLNAPVLIAVSHLIPTRRASRIAAACVSGAAGFVTAVVPTWRLPVLVDLLVTVVWSSIGLGIGARVAFGKRPRAANSASP